MSRDNRATIERGLAEAVRTIKSRLAERAMLVGHAIVNEAESERKYNSFTGNTASSYTAGVFVDGRKYAERDSGAPAPIHAKVGEGETLFLDEPIEGEPRSITGETELHTPYADQLTSIIMEEQPMLRNGVAIRFAVGVEYDRHLPGGSAIEELREIAQDRMASSLTGSIWQGLI